MDEALSAHLRRGPGVGVLMLSAEAALCLNQRCGYSDLARGPFSCHKGYLNTIFLA